MLAFAMVLVSSAGAFEGPTEQLPHVPGILDRWDSERSWATPLVIQTLDEALGRLAWELPHADPVTVGDLSVQGGGPMYGHSTHDEGIDADLGLFVRGGRQPAGFLDVPAEDLDPEATWQLITALLDTGNVQFILLDQGHIDAVRSWLDATGYPTSLSEEIFVPRSTRLRHDLRGVVRHAPNHRSHLHVRITSPPPAEPVN